MVHGRVDLDEVVIGTGADVATHRGNDTGGHGAAKPERVADSHHPVADPNLVVVRECDIGEFARFLDFQECEVRARIGANEFGVEFGAVIHDDGVFRAAVDDVVVRHQIAVFRNEEARALGNRTGALRALRRAVSEAFVRAELRTEVAEEFLQRRR